MNQSTTKRLQGQQSKSIRRHTQSTRVPDDRDNDSYSSTEEADSVIASRLFGEATVNSRKSRTVNDNIGNEDDRSNESPRYRTGTGTDYKLSERVVSSPAPSRRPVWRASTSSKQDDASSDYSFDLSALSPQTQNIINSITPSRGNTPNSSRDHKKRFAADRAMVDEILREARAQAAARASTNASLPMDSTNNDLTNGTGITIDTTASRLKKEQRYIARSPTSPRSTRKRAVLRRTNAKLFPVHSSPQSSSSAKHAMDPPEVNGKTPSSNIETVETGELDEIEAQFQETLTTYTKRFQNSTVALQEQSNLMRRNQDLLHLVAAKEEEIENLKNKLFESTKKLDSYEVDLKDAIAFQLEPLALSAEDLIRIERELENQDVAIRNYRAENDKLNVQIKELKNQLSNVDKENEKYSAKTSELMRELDHLRAIILYDKENKDHFSEGVLQQMEEMNKEISRLKQIEKEYEKEKAKEQAKEQDNEQDNEQDKEQGNEEEKEHEKEHEKEQEREQQREQEKEKEILISPMMPMLPPTGIMHELETKQNIIEELVEKLKRKEEQLEYYQNQYLAKTEELEQYIEQGGVPSNATQNGGGGSDGHITKTPNAVGGKAGGSTGVGGGVNGAKAIKYLNDNIQLDDEIEDLSSLPITSDLLASGIFDALGGDGAFTAIERLIASLERTIMERDVQLSTAHQRAEEAERKLVNLSREKMSWGSGFDGRIKNLKNKIQQMEELIQMERKAARKSLSSQASQADNDRTRESIAHSDSKQQELSNQSLLQQLELMSRQITTMGEKFKKREQDLQKMISDMDKRSKVQLEMVKKRCLTIIGKKNDKLEIIKSELDSLMEAAGPVGNIKGD
ncbi:1013_t:CDS:2 [Paraglomus brasilianum]|uniref:1013_t:CDS:1 n=1 Tax=Paraglomus brasilianum TaxID=144538 RepID=A0A9N8YUL7_9GLOM|nr:1013_t:CDS:2 [Paraglomus brasilianum]